MKETFHTKTVPEAKRFAPSFNEFRGLRSILGGQKNLETTKSMPKFLSGLKNSKIPEEIQALAAGLNIDLRLTPMYSRLAFQHIIRIGSNLRMLIRFLENPSLGAPAARNLNTLLLWHIKQEANEDDKRLLHLWVKQRVSQGLWRARELLLLLESVFRINGMIDTENIDCSLSRSIFEGLSSSAVFKFHDLKGNEINVLLGSVTTSSILQNGELLGIEMIKCSSTSQLPRMGPGISSFMIKCLLHMDRHQKVQNFDRNIVTKLLKLLQRAPVSIEVESIAAASTALLRCRENASVSFFDLLKNLNEWWSLLQEHGRFKILRGNGRWLQVERLIAHQKTDILAPYLQLLNDEEKCCFLLRNWFIPEIGMDPTWQLEVAQHIENNFRHDLTLPRARLSPFVTMLQSLGSKLPDNSKWISPLFSLLHELGRSLTVLKIVRASQALGFRISRTAIVHEISQTAQSQPHMAYHLFKSAPNVPLEACPVVAEIMIHNPRFNPSSALLYRRRRQKLLSPLNQFVPEPRNILSRFTWKFPCGESLEIRDYRASLLDRMALAYAQALHLYPRVAFRNVYQCYRLFKWYHLGPLSVDMSRALTIAGVLRPLQAGKRVSTMQVRWILKVVSEVEGEEIARGVDALCYKWRTEVIHRTSKRKAWERRLEGMGILAPQPVRKRLRGKTLTRWMDGRKARNRRRGS